MASDLTTALSESGGRPQRDMKACLKGHLVLQGSRRSVSPRTCSRSMMPAMSNTIDRVLKWREIGGECGATRVSLDTLVEGYLYEKPEAKIITPYTMAPRQFEYHPRNAGRMLVGSGFGSVHVLNPGNGSEICSGRALHGGGVLGLCWLNGHDDRFLAGNDKGRIHMMSMEEMTDGNDGGSVQQYESFPELTSIHLNCTDRYFLTSGFGRDIALYDIARGDRLALYRGLHEQHINVLKFSHQHPSIFATSSFDGLIKLWDLRDMSTQTVPIHIMQKPIFQRKSVGGNVMVCWSPDDRYLLSSAVDNEVCQLDARSGQLQREFDLHRTGQDTNYTRAYYMNNGEYIVVGSCCESAVKVVNSDTGKLLRNVSIGYSPESAVEDTYCQSLRGDPGNDFCFSAIMTFARNHHRSEIVRLNMLKPHLSREMDAG